jgi:hypothetical protein
MSPRMGEPSVPRRVRLSVEVRVEPFDWDLGVHAEEVVAVEAALGALDPVQALCGNRDPS